MKYTREQLRSMARTALQARAESDERYLQLVVQLSMQLDMPTDEVEQRIVMLAHDDAKEAA
ncbi:hypothetical protein PPN31114_03535 [Pandoraea pneumonica]|uniref:Uncharacterized protein n=1 Tax=Pandoraea pneumonica TaxID=2508299 RepID=A0A5E4WWM9_9BURK|nr:hypothetical protein [Pandoraea pneumonica]VVE28653.1 hypothetical protein PPN31114_03535 [Pandoraea pneumonica]